MDCGGGEESRGRGLVNCGRFLGYNVFCSWVTYLHVPAQIFNKKPTYYIIMLVGNISIFFQKTTFFSGRN